MTAIERHPDQGEMDGAVGAVETAPEVPTVGALQVLLGNRRAVLLDVVLPFAGYQLLVGRGAPAVVALSVTAVFPLVGTLGGWLRERRLDTLGIISLLFIAAGLIATLITGNPRLTLMKGSLFTGVFGLAFLGSLLLPRPLAFYLGRQMMTEGKPALIARWDMLWEYPRFRSGNRVVSVVWGCGLVLEALLRVQLALSLTTSMFLLTWSVLSYGIYATLLVWTVFYARR
jgi:hypothetical protein